MKRIQNRQLRVEALEHRELLAVSALPILEQFTNVSIAPVVEIKPGATNVKVADIYATAPTFQPERLADLAFASANTSSLAANVKDIVLRGDLNHRANDGCETVLAKGRIDPVANAVDFVISRQLWQTFGSKVHMEVDAEFNAVLSGNSLGLKLNKADVRNVLGKSLPQSQIGYGGAAPTIFPLKQPGVISFALDGSSPLNQTVSGGQQVVAAVIKVSATRDNYTVLGLKGCLVNPSSAGAVVSVSLCDSSSNTLLTTVCDAAGGFNFTGLKLQMAANTTKSLQVCLQLFSDVSVDTGTSGVNAKVQVTGLTAYDSSGVVTTVNSTATSNDLWVYKSVPTFTPVAASPYEGRNFISLLPAAVSNFTIAADSHGSVSLKQLMFSATVNEGTIATDPYLDSFKLFRDGVDITSQVTFSTSKIGVGTNSLVVTFTRADFIQPGFLATYKLVAIPRQIFPGASVTTTLATVLWSDDSAVAHDETTLDWFNGSGLPGLPLTKSIVSAL